MDDPNAYFERRMPWREANKRILDALQARELKAALFVCGSLVWALAKETGKFDGLLRYPGEDDEYEKPIMDALGL